jgi:hypothetical protein
VKSKSILWKYLLLSIKYIFLRDRYVAQDGFLYLIVTRHKLTVYSGPLRVLDNGLMTFHVAVKKRISLWTAETAYLGTAEVIGGSASASATSPVWGRGACGGEKPFSCNG